MDSRTQMFALFGNPVGHSLSPVMHNAAFRSMRMDAVYFPFCVTNLEGAVRGIAELGFRGVSVTIPFKTAVMAHLDRVEESARAIGAVNTILNDSGSLVGFNTDWTGLVRSLGESMEIRGRTFAVIGAGGAARAALFGLREEGGVPVVVNRSAARGEGLAREFGCPFFPLEEIGKVEADCLINTTPVGMSPDVNGTPVGRSDVARFRWVMDIVYSPLETRLLREAREAGCRTISGLGMFVHQGGEQIRIWTGQEAPVALMRQVVLQKLEVEKMGS